MKKIFTLLAAAAVSLSAMATTFTFTSASDLTQTKNGITVAIAKGSGSSAPAYYDNGLRLYASNTITVSGDDLSSISITFLKQGSKAYASLSASTGSLVSGGESTSDTDYKTDTWTGSGSSVTFTLGASGQRLIYQLVVNGDGSEVPGPGTPDTPSDLDPDFQYPDPTVLSVPSMTVQGDAYSFVENNVRVSSTNGAITESYFSVHAGYDLTFTAAKPIKGIVINGFVKKDYEATVDHGTISYLSPSTDTSADPVVVITDIDATSVTISNVKQLRCYSVEIYFSRNPEATVGGGSSNPNPGGGTQLNYDSAEVIYESEYSEAIGEPNYTIFLFNAAEPYVPYFALDIYPESKDNIAGTYTWDDYTLGDYCYYVFGLGDEDMLWVDGGEVRITKNGDSYTISGNLLLEDQKTYTISYTGKPDFYTDDEYYGDGGDESGVEAIAPAEENDSEGIMYDLMGRRVSKGFRGIYIRNGKKGVAF